MHLLNFKDNHKEYKIEHITLKIKKTGLRGKKIKPNMAVRERKRKKMGGWVRIKL